MRELINTEILQVSGSKADAEYFAQGAMIFGVAALIVVPLTLGLLYEGGAYMGIFPKVMVQISKKKGREEYKFVRVDENNNVLGPLWSS